MIDQAKRLRDLMQSRKEAKKESTKSEMGARVIAVASGKGGVGKSNFVTNLAIHMRKAGKRVVIIDADFGLANIEILMGINPRHTVADVLNGTVDMEAALTTGPMGCMFLSGGTGMMALSDVADKQLDMLIDGFVQLDNLADCIIIDTRAGLSNAVVNFIKAASETIIVTTPDPTAIADAYALIKSVKGMAADITEFKLVVNCTENDAEALEVHDKLIGVCERFLDIKLTPLGNIPYDSSLVRAVRKQKPVSLMFPNADSSRRIGMICAEILEMKITKRSSIQSFVLKLIGKYRD